MPNYSIDEKALKKRGFITRIGPKDYLTVAGTVFLAHDSGLLIAITTEVDAKSDPNWIAAEARATVYNRALVEEIAKLDLPEQTKHYLITEAAIGVFEGKARSKAKGGSNAEGTNPYEVAETSAIGRALRAAGYGEMESYASADEVAVAQSRLDGSPTAPQKKLIKDLVAQKFGAEANLETTALDRFDKALAKLTKDDAATWIEELKALPDVVADAIPF